MKGTRRLLAGVLAALVLATPLLAAGPYEAEHQARAEDLTFLVETLEEVHPDLYANTTREAVAAKKAYIEQNMDGWDILSFSAELRALVGMVGDSHTNLGIKTGGNPRKLALDLQVMGGKWIVNSTTKEQAAFLGGEVLGFNVLTMDEVQKKVGTLLCADNAVYAQRKLSQYIYLWDVMVHFGVIRADQQSIELSVRTLDGKTQTVTAAPMTTEEMNKLVTDNNFARLDELCESTPVTAVDYDASYKWLDLGGGNLYIQYNRCFEDEEFPMDAFAAQVKAQLDTGAYGRVIVDLRNNGGGSDGVIWGFMKDVMVAQQGGLELYGLMGANTFSSALINAVQLGQVGATMVGEATGGSVDHFGAVRSFELPNSKIKVTHSTKFIDMDGYFEAAKPYGVESFQPDIQVVQTVEDTLNGVDAAVEAILAKPVTIPANTAEAKVSDAKVLLNGKETALPGYLIGGEHYVALRDLASVLSGTKAQFEVLFRPEGVDCVGFVPGKAYTPVGGELAALQDGTAMPGTEHLLLGGGMYLQLAGAPGSLRAYNVGNRNYVRLRDLGGKLGFSVVWDADGSAVRITA